MFLGTLTNEADALDAITAIRERFNFTGTLFTPTDVSDMAGNVLSNFDAADFEEAFRDGIVQEVTHGYEYRKLGDILSERGNETLGDAVVSAVSLLEEGTGYTFTVRLLVYRDIEPPLFPAIDRAGFTSATDAFQWARSRMGTLVTSPTDGVESLVLDTAVGQCVEGFSLAVMDGDVQVGLIRGTAN